MAIYKLSICRYFSFKIFALTIKVFRNVEFIKAYHITFT